MQVTLIFYKLHIDNNNLTVCMHATMVTMHGSVYPQHKFTNLLVLLWTTQILEVNS